MCQPNDGLRRVGDGDNSPRFLEVAENSDDEEKQLLEALRRSRMQIEAGQGSSSSSSSQVFPQARAIQGSSSSSSSQVSPEARALQELAGCSLDEAVQALRTFGSADAAADALLGGTPEPAASIAPKAASLSETGKRPTAVSMA
eukprot:s10761_g1.t2